MSYKFNLSQLCIVLFVLMLTPLTLIYAAQYHLIQVGIGQCDHINLTPTGPFYYPDCTINGKLYQANNPICATATGCPNCGYNQKTNVSLREITASGSASPFCYDNSRNGVAVVTNNATWCLWLDASGNRRYSMIYNNGNGYNGAANFYASWMEGGTWALATPSSNNDCDGDGIPDTTDNCMTVPNSTQIDFNKNGKGCACDPTELCPWQSPLCTPTSGDDCSSPRTSITPQPSVSSP